MATKIHKIQCDCSGGHIFEIETSKDWCTDMRCTTCPTDNVDRKIVECECSSTTVTDNVDGKLVRQIVNSHKYLQYNEEKCDMYYNKN